jgi:hypothetical protein
MNSLFSKRNILFKSIVKPGLRVKVLLLLKRRNRSMKIVSQTGVVLRLKSNKSSLFTTSSVFNYRFFSMFFLDSKNLIRFWVY